MVHIKDDGSHFDAPIETVWKYLNTPEQHGSAHKNRRNVQVQPAGEGTILLSQEQNVGGQWHKVVNRITLYPPVGMAIEMLEGPLAGSKSFTFYTPKGSRTGVTVVGEFASKVLPGPQVETAVLKFLEEVFNEDNAAMRTMAKKP